MQKLVRIGKPKGNRVWRGEFPFLCSEPSWSNCIMCSPAYSGAFIDIHLPCQTVSGFLVPGPFGGPQRPVIFEKVDSCDNDWWEFPVGSQILPPFPFPRRETRWALHHGSTTATTTAIMCQTTQLTQHLPLCCAILILTYTSPSHLTPNGTHWVWIWEVQSVLIPTFSFGLPAPAHTTLTLWLVLPSHLPVRGNFCKFHSHRGDREGSFNDLFFWLFLLLFHSVLLPFELLDSSCPSPTLPRGAIIKLALTEWQLYAKYVFTQLFWDSSYKSLWQSVFLSSYFPSLNYLSSLFISVF